MICTRCAMDDTDPALTFDEQGHCSFCERYLEQRAARGYQPGQSEKELDALVKAMKRDGEGREYDCVLGLSGGVDSAYMAYLSAKLGLRVLAVHVDSGWNSEVAVRNIERVCQRLRMELHTYVMDWPTMKELQRALMTWSGFALPKYGMDGDFGSETRDWVKKFQRDKKITVDGVVGPQTWSKLDAI